MEIDPFTIIVLIFIVVASAIFFLRSRIIRLMHWTLQILFPVLLILVLTGLFLPQFYTSLADNSLHTWGTYSSLKSIDTGINALVSAPQGLINDIQNLFGGRSEEVQNFQYAETQIYPGLVSGLSGLYRVLVIVLSSFGMALIVYLSYSTAGAYTSAKLEQKVKLLEARIAELEAKSQPTSQ